MSFFKDLKEDIAQSVNELTESLDENLTVDDEKTKETVPMSDCGGCRAGRSNRGTCGSTGGRSSR